VLGMVVSGT